MSYFVKVPDAKGLRRKVLESSKATIHMLRGYQQLLEIRGRKVSAMNEARKELKEITLLINKLEELMPTLSKRELSELTEAHMLPTLPEQKPKTKAAKKAKKAARSAVLDRLNADDGPKVYIGKPEQLEEKKPAPSVARQEPEPIQAPEEPARKESELDRLQRQLREIDVRLDEL